MFNPVSHTRYAGDYRRRKLILGIAQYKISELFSDRNGRRPWWHRPGCHQQIGFHSGYGESPDRFARDLAVQLAGHDMLKGLGIDLIPASAPDFFTEDTPTAVLVRQVLGAIAQFEKASLVAKLKAARDRKRARDGKCEGRRSHLEMKPELVALAKRLRRRNPKTGERLSFRAIAAKLEGEGYMNIHGRRFAAEFIKAMIRQG